MDKILKKPQDITNRLYEILERADHRYKLVNTMEDHEPCTLR